MLAQYRLSHLTTTMYTILCPILLHAKLSLRFVSHFSNNLVQAGLSLVLNSSLNKKVKHILVLFPVFYVKQISNVSICVFLHFERPTGGTCFLDFFLFIESKMYPQGVCMRGGMFLKKSFYFDGLTCHLL